MSYITDIPVSVSNQPGYANQQNFLDSIPNLEVKIKDPLSEEKIPDQITLIQNNGPATKFTYNMFLNKPHLLKNNIFTLFYAQYSGRPYPAETIYEIFRSFITTRNNRRIAYYRQNLLGYTNEFINPRVFQTDIHLLISWARALKYAKTAIVFEPVMENLNKVLNTWLSNRVVIFNGAEYNIDIFKPLCYTANGENFIDLLPYLCYLMTFYIHCKPYSFNEGLSNASGYGFSKAIENWFNINYENFSNDYGLNIIESDLQILNKIDDDKFISFYNYMLNPLKIIEIRNKVLKSEPTLLDECVSDQNGCDIKFITSAWRNTMMNMMQIIIESNPIKKIYDKIPLFDSGKINIRELQQLTHYCLGGGNKPFCIDPNTYTYIGYNEKTPLHKLSDKIFGKQELRSNIKSLTISLLNPFSCTDFLLELGTAYVAKKFDEKRGDLLDDYPITISQSDLIDNTFGHKIDSINGLPLDVISLKNQLINLYVQGVWMYDNSVMSTLMNFLLSQNFNNEFMLQINDLLNLDNVTILAYNNRLASILIVPYILSLINKIALNHMNDNYHIKTLDIFSYVFNIDVNAKVINKLSEMLTAILYIRNSSYAQFVNLMSAEFSKIITSNAIIQIPYVKGLDDLADLYSMGGVEMYNYAQYSNPFIRAYGMYTYTLGNSEPIETFYKWITQIDNSSLFETIQENRDNISVIEMLLQSQWNKFKSGKSTDNQSMNSANIATLGTKYYDSPNILQNYNFKADGSYEKSTQPYFIGLKINDEKTVIQELAKYIFDAINVNNTIPREIYSRRMIYMQNNTVDIRAPIKSLIRVDKKGYPLQLAKTGVAMDVVIYDVNAEVKSTNIIYTNPPNTTLIPLIIGNSRVDRNNAIWIFSTIKVNDRFKNYELINTHTQPASSTGVLVDRIISKRPEASGGRVAVEGNNSII